MRRSANLRKSRRSRGSHSSRCAAWNDQNTSKITESVKIIESELFQDYFCFSSRYMSCSFLICWFSFMIVSLYFLSSAVVPAFSFSSRIFACAISFDIVSFDCAKSLLNLASDSASLFSRVAAYCCCGFMSKMAIVASSRSRSLIDVCIDWVRVSISDFLACNCCYSSCNYCSSSFIFCW